MQPQSTPSDSDIARFWSKAEKNPDGCWLWKHGRFRGGYGAFRFAEKQWKAHRFSWFITYGEIPEKLLVCHHCDTPSCVRPDHLFLDTHEGNMADAARKGRSVPLWTVPIHCPKERKRRGATHPARLHPEMHQGERNGHAKLTEAQVREIRTRREAGERQCILAREFGVLPYAIWKIVTRRTWKHLP